MPEIVGLKPIKCSSITCFTKEDKGNAKINFDAHFHGKMLHGPMKCNSYTHHPDEPPTLSNSIPIGHRLTLDQQKQVYSYHSIFSHELDWNHWRLIDERVYFC